MTLIRVSRNPSDKGEDYFLQLVQETEKNFKVLLSLLSSYWQSRVDGPNYARELKSVAFELSRIRLALENIQIDNDFKSTRTDFLYQTITSMVFPYQSGSPNLGKSDLDFKEFLIEIIKLYFKGSTPDSIKKAIEIISGKSVIIRENFLEARKEGSGFDISDQFGFSIEIDINSPSELDVFLTSDNIKIVLDLLRPAHTLYNLKYILNDVYPDKNITSSSDKEKMTDAFSSELENYHYDDFRKFYGGLFKIDFLGTKKSINITGESHIF
jgi:hypothetical protein